MEAVVDRQLRGQGTEEAEWLGWPAWKGVASVDAARLVPEGYRAVMVAPHPDDEVLAVGGLLSCCAALGREVAMVAVTDGTASHPRSSEWPPERLAKERPLESSRAWRCLGLGDSRAIRLGIADGGVAGEAARLSARLGEIFTPQDVVFTTWRLDGHPDHEATAKASIEAADRCGARLVEVPVWGWHWARPAEPHWPWSRMRRVALDPDTVRRKRQAVACFASQLQPDRSTGAPPILLDSTVERAARDFEVVFA